MPGISVVLPEDDTGTIKINFMELPDMTNIVPVEREWHQGKCWRPLQNFNFAASHAVVPLIGSEFAQALTTLPIGFIMQAGGYLPVGLMAVKTGKNLLVGPGGQWLGNHIPFLLRSYPFSLLHKEGGDQSILAIDEDSGMIVDAWEEGVEKIFEEDGSLSSAVTAVAEYLRVIERDREATAAAVAALAETDVIKPWPLTVLIGNDSVTVSGLYRVDEEALNVLDDTRFSKLRRAGSLGIAYGQLLSIGQVDVLVKLSLAREKIAQAAELDISSTSVSNRKFS